MRDYKDSVLWKRELAARGNDAFQKQRDMLRVAYEHFWDRSIVVSQTIAKDFPDLTLHNEKHFSALWDCASLITGDDYDINPLEVFVLGGAILLHDLGHALVAYEGGIEEVKQTDAYKDALVAIMSRDSEEQLSAPEIENPKPEQHKAALFEAVRILHADQAEKLAKLKFNGKSLISDDEIRDSLAEIMGKIAKSHHYDHHKLHDIVGESQGAPPYMPPDWHIDSIKIACILRCADAIQIDERRAPAFERALHDPQGESLKHWLAQKLGQPKIDSDGEKPYALKFTSQNDIEEKDAEAWWIVHDLIRNADQELRGCYRLMSEYSLPPLLVDRVAGATSPEELAKCIRPKNWRPISAEVRVTDPNYIIRLFGGEKLYGNDPVVPLRELIQNAADAVRARRALEDQNYKGRIDVSLRPEGDHFILCVQDNGLGMSEAVMTGSLIEFGKSFWKSRDAQLEFPGLVSRNLKQTGRYGIGFFSTLMISEEITVTSKRYDKGVDDARTLSFRKGLSLRPLLSSAKGKQLSTVSTRIEMKVSSEIIEELLNTKIDRHDIGIGKVTLKQLCSHLCPILDCDVYTSENNEKSTLSHSEEWYEQDGEQWLRDVCLADVRNNNGLDDYIKTMAPLLRVIYDNHHKPIGRAAIGMEDYLRAGISTIGSFCSGDEHKQLFNFSTNHVGVLAYKPASPARNSGHKFENHEKIEIWATDQSHLIADLNHDKYKNYISCINIAGFSGDPLKIACIYINRKIVSIKEIYNNLSNGNEMLVPVGYEEDGLYIIVNILYKSYNYIRIRINDNQIIFKNNIIERIMVPFMSSAKYFYVPTEADSHQNSFLSCLQRYTALEGRELNIEHIEEAEFGTYTGPSLKMENIKKGMQLTGSALKLSLKPIN